MTSGFLGLHFTQWASGDFRGNIADPSTRLPLHPSRASHANASRQRIRHGLSRCREGPAAGVRARLDRESNPGPSPLAARGAASAEKIAGGDVEGGLTMFFDAIEGRGAWTRLPATPKQQLRDNAFPLIGQSRDRRPPFSKSDAEAIKTPTLFIGGGNTKGALPKVLHTLAANIKGSKTAMIPHTTHPIFEQAPQKFCEIVLEFLAG